MAPYTFYRVLNPTDSEVETCSILLYELQKDVPEVVCLLGGDASLLKLQATATIRAGALDGEVYIVKNVAGELVGFSVWMPPGAEMFSTPEQRELGFNELTARLSEETKEYFRTTYMAEFPAFVNNKLGTTGKLDSWWLNMLMVRRDCQRQGVGTSLVNMVREKASKTGGVLACASSYNLVIPAYICMGFDHLGQKIMHSPWGEWPLNIFSMKVARVDNN